MSERSGLFAGDDPFEIARAWLAEAEKTEINDPNAIALATVDANGLPNARMVLLKEIEADAFVFYTNYESAKGQELDQAGKASFVMRPSPRTILSGRSVKVICRPAISVTVRASA